MLWTTLAKPADIEMSRERVISLVPSRHSKDLKWWISVTGRLQLSFIWQAKDGTPSRREDRLTTKGRLQSILAPPFICLSPPPLEPALCKLGQLRRRVCFTWNSHSSLWIFFCFIFADFSPSLCYSHHHFGPLFPILTA